MLSAKANTYSYRIINSSYTSTSKVQLLSPKISWTNLANLSFFFNGLMSFSQPVYSIATSALQAFLPNKIAVEAGDIVQQTYYVYRTQTLELKVDTGLNTPVFFEVISAESRTTSFSGGFYILEKNGTISRFDVDFGNIEWQASTYYDKPVDMFNKAKSSWSISPYIYRYSFDGRLNSSGKPQSSLTTAKSLYSGYQITKLR